jgi:ABC-type proline/glycine betaine transport system permease subunit
MADLTALVETLAETLGEGRAGLLFGLVTGLAFGVAAQRSQFCLRAATVEFARGTLGPRLAIWLLAFSTALVWVQGAGALGLFRAADARMMAVPGSWSGAILGGLMFGVGMVPGVIATIIFALPPIIRFTNLGIRGVQEDLIEAAYAFGSTPRQVLWEIQLPLAMRTIMAGLNQTLMLALSMAVITALIGGGGLGLTVFTGLGRLNVGTATEGGIGIVLLAIILDRITQALGEQRKVQTPSLWQTFRSLFGAGKPLARPAD